MKKQKTLIIVMAVLFVVLLVLYFAVIRPLTAAVEDDSIAADLIEGEVMITAKTSNFYIFQPIERSSMQSIEVKNEFGGYKIYRDASDKFQLDGFLGLQFNQELFSSLVVTTGTPTAMMRVAVDLDEEGLAEYGLDDPQASWTITTTTGEKFTMYVGDALVTEGGYYVKYEPRNAVYILSNTLADTVLKPDYAMLQPLLTAGMSANDYFLAEDFTVWHGDELFVHVDKVPEAEMKNPEGIVEVVLTYPMPETKEAQSLYTLNDSLYFEVLYNFMALQGTEVLAFLPDEAQLEEFGLLDPAYTIRYVFNDYEFIIFVSERQADGTYNAVSSLYGFSIVCSVAPESLGWLEYSHFDWLSATPFYENINNVNRITLKGSGIDSDFRLMHGTDEDGDVTLEVKDEVSGVVIPNKDVKNFREYYKTLLNITNQEYATLSEEDRLALIDDEDQVMLTMTYETADGKLYEYKFYRYVELSTGKISGGKIFVTVNGLGEFYTTNDLINKVIDDNPRVLAGLDINAYTQY